MLEMELYQRLVETACGRLADLELDYGVEKSKLDSVRSRLFGALRPYYQECDRLRLLVQFRKGSARALAEIMRRITRTAGAVMRASMASRPHSAANAQVLRRAIKVADSSRTCSEEGAELGKVVIMLEVRKLPDDELLALAAQVDEEAARAVDHRFECLVREGRFEDMAAEALREEKEGKTIPRHEVLDERGVS